MILHELVKNLDPRGSSAAHRDRLARFQAAAKKVDDDKQRAIEEAERARLQRHAELSAHLADEQRKRDEAIHALIRQRSEVMERLKVAEPTIFKIKHLVMETYRLSDDDLLAKYSVYRVVMPRQIMYYLCGKYTVWALSRIGRFFRRDHTTVLYACKKVSRERAKDRKLDDELSLLESKLHEMGLREQPREVKRREHWCKWNDDEVASLRELWAQQPELTSKEIAIRLNTSYHAVTSKAQRLGLPPKKPGTKAACGDSEAMK